MGRTIGVILILVGIVLLVWTGFTYTKKEKVVDAGPIEITASREKTIDWPPYAGGIVLVVGAVLFIFGKKKS